MGDFSCLRLGGKCITSLQGSPYQIARKKTSTFQARDPRDAARSRQNTSVF